MMISQNTYNNLPLISNNLIGSEIASENDKQSYYVIAYMYRLFKLNTTYIPEIRRNNDKIETCVLFFIVLDLDFENICSII